MRISDLSSDVCSSDLLNNNYKQYTCYGCHEHQPTKIITKHREEGLTNIENCVRCHRSAHGEAAGEHEGERSADSRSITRRQIGRASCRESVCQSVEISGVGGSLTKKMMGT